MNNFIQRATAVTAANGLASIVSADRMALYLKANYGFKPSPSHSRMVGREIDRIGDLPPAQWKKLVKDITALGAKLLKPKKGYEYRQMYKLGEIVFNGELDETVGLVGLVISSPNPKFDGSPYIGRPDE